VVNKKASIVRVYLPPDANCLLSVWDHCLRSRNYVNVVSPASNLPRSGSTWTPPSSTAPQGLGIWRVGQQRPGRRARCGHGLLRRRAHAGDAGRGADPARASSGLKIRVVNVVDLMKLQPPSEHPHG
jgi:xylulose-5-phosphate/fructose-6-phosphate phosphoketolase